MTARVTAAGANLEVSPNPSSVNVTAVGVYLELSPNPSSVDVTAAGVYLELSPGNVVSVSASGAYVEIAFSGDDHSDDAPVGNTAYVYDVVGLAAVLPRGTFISQFIAYAELINRNLYTTTFINLVEIGQTDLRVTQFMNLVEIEYVEPPPEPPLMPTYFPRADGMRAIHKMLPEEKTGYAFDPAYSWWSTVVAEESENLIINSSFERGLTSNWMHAGTNAPGVDAYEVVGATHGRWSARVVTTPAQNYVFYTQELDVLPGAYTFSFDFYSQMGCEIIPFVQNQSAAIGNNPFNTYSKIAARQIEIPYSGWERYEITAIALASGTFRVGVYIVEQGRADTVYTDSWQFENKPYATTFIHGDMIGWKDVRAYQSYFWRGDVDESPAVRRKRTGSGGRIVSWSDNAGFLTTSIVGLGMSPVINDTQDMADGSVFHLRNRSAAREFSIVGRIFGENYPELSQRRNDLVRILKPDNTPTGDQTLLRYRHINERGQASGIPLEIVCSYRSGLEGSVTNFYQESIPLQFYAPEPFLQETIESSFIMEEAQIVPVSQIVLRDADGDYKVLIKSSLLHATVGRVNAADIMDDGRPIAVGNFTQLCGFVGVNKIAVWENEEWLQLGSVPAATVTSLDAGGPGRLYPMALATADPAGAEYGIYEYDDSDPDKWVNIATTSVYFNALKWPSRIKRADNGDIYFICYDETNVDHVYRIGVVTYGTNVVTEFSWGISINETLGFSVDDIAIDDDYAYFVGKFQYTEVGDPPEIASWGVVAINKDTYAKSRLGKGVGIAGDPTYGGRIRRAWIGKDQALYAVGEFSKEYDLATGVPGRQLRGFAKWDGSAWTEVVPISRQGETYGVPHVHVDRDDVVWLASDTAPIEEHQMYGPQHMLGYKNGVFYPPFLEEENDGDVIMEIRSGGNSTENTDIFVVGPWTAPAQNMRLPHLNLIENYGDAETPLYIRIYGAGRPSFIRNMDTSQISFGVMPEIIAGDYITIRSDSQKSMIYSKGDPNMNRFLIGGMSNLRDLRLLPGVNRISTLILGTSAQPAYCTWKNRYWGFGSAFGRG